MSAGSADPWLHVIGIGEDGMAGLMPAARALARISPEVLGRALREEEPNVREAAAEALGDGDRALGILRECAKDMGPA